MPLIECNITIMCASNVRRIVDYGSLHLRVSRPPLPVELNPVGSHPVLSRRFDHLCENSHNFESILTAVLSILNAAVDRMVAGKCGLCFAALRYRDRLDSIAGSLLALTSAASFFSRGKCSIPFLPSLRNSLLQTIADALSSGEKRCQCQH